MKLNPRQRKFVENIEEGMSLIDAYIGAGYKDKKPGVYSCASQLFRNPKILEEFDNRLFGRKRAAQQRFGGMTDGSTNVYIKILKLKADLDPKLLELQRKVAEDVFDRMGLKPKQEVEHSGAMSISPVFYFGDKLTEEDI